MESIFKLVDERLRQSESVSIYDLIVLSESRIGDVMAAKR